jgi:hypothetical protein
MRLKEVAAKRRKKGVGTVKDGRVEKKDGADSASSR